MKNRIIMMAALVVLMWSCDQDNEDQIPDFIPVETAKTAIENMNSGLETEMAEMQNTKGGQALENLTVLLDGGGANLRSLNRSGISRIGSAIENINLDVSAISIFENATNEDVFDFNDSKGVYVYDFDLMDFVKTDEVVDHVQIHYPTEGSTSNNAIFKLNEFVQTELEGELVPSKIIAQLYVDDQLELSFDLEVDYGFFGIIESVELGLFLAPFDLELSFNLSLSSISFSTAISRDEEELLSASLTGLFSDNPNEEFSALDVSFSYGTVILLGTMDLEGLNNAGAEDDPNEFIDLNFYSNEYGVHNASTLLGTVVFMPTEESEEILAYIEYTDGSTELLSEALEGLFSSVEVIFEGV
ncbi:MAG: hypothetical protein JXR07_13870 [Reichenbachiella sp.]